MTQTFAPVTDRDIVPRIRLSRPEKCPPLTLIVGPCRSGTTAVLRAAAATGHRAYFQPVKRILRQASVGRPEDFVVDPGTERIVVKETFGPFLPAEARFDPVALLAAAGYPVERVNLVVLLRHPVDTYLSWQRLYRAGPLSTDVDTSVFVTAFRHTVRVYEDARVPVTAFVPDGITMLDEATALANLFHRTGLAYGPAAVAWHTHAARPLDELIERQPEPDEFRAPGALDGVRGADRYRFIARGTGAAGTGVPDEVLALQGEYDRFRQRCAVDLNDCPEPDER
jgi:hypothetical protein